MRCCADTLLLLLLLAFFLDFLMDTWTRIYALRAKKKSETTREAGLEDCFLVFFTLFPTIIYDGCMMARANDEGYSVPVFMINSMKNICV